MSETQLRHGLVDGAGYQLDTESIAMKLSAVQHGLQIAIFLGEQLEQFQGRPPEVWYPSLIPTPPMLAVTLHADSLIHAAADEKAACDWLVETSGHKDSYTKTNDIDLKSTVLRNAQNARQDSHVIQLDAQHARPSFRELYTLSLREGWDEQRAREQPRAAYIDLYLHLADKRHVFVTLDEALLEDAIQPTWRRDTLVFRPTEAQRYVDLYLKAFGRFRIQPWYTANRGAYYWMRLCDMLPAFRSAWPYVVFGEDALPEGSIILDFMHALYARILGQMQSFDRIGWLRYSPPNNDTRAEMLNQLNYFIVLATGVFDSLAWLAAHRFQLLGERATITLKARLGRNRRNPFFGQLEVIAPELVGYLERTEVQDRIALFYAPRDSIQHRLVLTGGRLFTGQYLSDCNVVRLSTSEASPITRIDAMEPANEPFTLWGLITFADSGQTILEPYRFARTALQFILRLVDDVLSRLRFDEWMAGQPDLKNYVDTLLEQIKQTPLRNLAGFAVPYP